MTTKDFAVQLNNTDRETTAGLRENLDSIITRNENELFLRHILTSAVFLEQAIYKRGGYSHEAS